MSRNKKILPTCIYVQRTASFCKLLLSIYCLRNVFTKSEIWSRCILSNNICIASIGKSMYISRGTLNL